MCEGAVIYLGKWSTAGGLDQYYFASRQCGNEYPCMHFKCTVKVNLQDTSLEFELLFGAAYVFE